MKPLLSTLLQSSVLVMSVANMAHAERPSFTYNVRTIKKFNIQPMNGHVSIQVLTLKTANGLNQSAILAINRHLSSSADRFTKNAKDCLYSNPGNMWSYDLKFEKVTQTDEYISFIFHKDRICAGTPDFDKEVRTYAKADGTYIPISKLFKKAFPTARNLNAEYSTELISLDVQMSKRLLEDSASSLKEFDPSCEGYLIRTSYRIWLEANKAVFYPEFRQVHSNCQREYMIFLAKK